MSHRGSDKLILKKAEQKVIDSYDALFGEEWDYCSTWDSQEKFPDTNAVGMLCNVPAKSSATLLDQLETIANHLGLKYLPQDIMKLEDVEPEPDGRLVFCWVQYLNEA